MSMQPSSLPTATASDSARIHLTFLDGVRGLAALYVVTFHLMMTQDLSQHLPTLLFWATRWLRYGHFAVDMFIVLSGYCLMLPVARSKDGFIPRGRKLFFFRRARRILPPFWAALAFTLIMILLVRATGSRARADDGTAFLPANLVTHVLMIHNLYPKYSGSIDLPMWTVAIEWQIYFVFAGLLLPIWRRCGAMFTMVVALTLGELPLLVLPASYDLRWTCPWYLGLFSMGMTAALIHFSADGVPRWPAIRRWRWGWIVVGLLAIIVAIEIMGGDARALDALWAKDVLVGLCAAATLVFVAGIVVMPGDPHPAMGNLVAALLQSRWVVTLGTFSYSLYLIHMPLMWPIKFVVRYLHLSPYEEFAFRLTIAPLAMLPIAYAFHRMFERPFMSAASFPQFRFRGSQPRVVVVGDVPAMAHSPNVASL